VAPSFPYPEGLLLEPAGWRAFRGFWSPRFFSPLEFFSSVSPSAFIAPLHPQDYAGLFLGVRVFYQIAEKVPVHRSPDA